VKEIFANQPGRPKPVVDQPAPQALPVSAAAPAQPAPGLADAAADASPAASAEPASSLAAAPPTPLAAHAQPASGLADATADASRAIHAEPASGLAAATPPTSLAAHAQPAPGLADAAAGLLEAGLRFLESMAAEPPAHPSEGAADYPAQRAVTGWFTRDPHTNRPVLSIPLPESVTSERLAGALAGLLRAFGRGAA
jgi:hypothetical protein